MPKSSTTFRGILICANFRPKIFSFFTFLYSVLHWRIISIKRFFSGVHACVNGSRCSHKLYINVLWTFIQFVSASAPFTSSCMCKRCRCTRKLYMNSCKETFNTIITTTKRSQCYFCLYKKRKLVFWRYKNVFILWKISLIWIEVEILVIDNCQMLWCNSTKDNY